MPILLMQAAESYEICSKLVNVSPSLLPNFDAVTYFIRHAHLVPSRGDAVNSNPSLRCRSGEQNSGLFFLVIQ